MIATLPIGEEDRTVQAEEAAGSATLAAVEVTEAAVEVQDISELQFVATCVTWPIAFVLTAALVVMAAQGIRFVVIPMVLVADHPATVKQLITGAHQAVEALEVLQADGFTTTAAAHQVVHRVVHRVVVLAILCR